MKRNILWSKLKTHPMSGWINVSNYNIPKIQTGSRLLWCGIGGSLLASDALVRIFTFDKINRNWISLASPEFIKINLRSSDQLVFASKSGMTIELWTWISRLLAIPEWHYLNKVPLIITQYNNNPLAQWGEVNNYPIIPISNNIGGRYSAFTAMGTLPLSWLGLNIDSFLNGGIEVVKSLDENRKPWANKIWHMVNTLYKYYLHGIQEWVILPYNQCIEPLTTWWVQLVAESLSKINKNGKHIGLTPIRSIGPMDQHAQLQRWLAGPKNIGLIVLTMKNQIQIMKDNLNPPKMCPYPILSKLQGNMVLDAQAKGTLESLKSAGIPAVHWILEPLSEYSIGTFMMAWQLIVSLTGLALGVDPFDQPEVEDSKTKVLKKLDII